MARARNIVVRDGLVVGGLRRALGPRQVTLTVTLLVPLAPVEIAALEDAADTFGRFVGQPIDLRLTRADRS